MELGAFWKATLAVAGLAAIASFVLWSLYKKWLSLPIFSTLTTSQQYRLLRLFLLLTFLFAVAALITYSLLQIRSTESSQPIPAPEIRVSKLAEADALSNTFPLKASEPLPTNSVLLNFRASLLGLQFPIAAPTDTYPHALLDQLINHFSLKEHVHLDSRLYPTGLRGGFWYQDWTILLNGSVVGREYLDQDAKTFSELGASHGDRVSLKVSWSLGINVSSDGMARTGEKAREPEPIEL